MKAPKARKLPSGAWFCRVRVNGQDISITRPTRKEAEREAQAIKLGFKTAVRSDKTLRQACEDYIAKRTAVLSPSTIRGYRGYINTRFAGIMDVKVSALTPEKCRRAVNAEAKTISAKYLKNAWGFIASAIEEETGTRPDILLPQVVEKDLPWLEPEQIPIFCRAVKGEPCEIPALLGLCSLRKSEIAGLKWKDIDLENNRIYIRGAAVLDENGNVVYKETNKNTTSRRVIPFILPQLKEALEAVENRGEYVVTVYPGTMRKQVNQVCAKAGLPLVGMHGLRRSFASLAKHIGMSEDVAMRIGGWADIYTMRKIYTKVSQKDMDQQTEMFTSFFKNDNENDNERLES